MTTLSFQTLQSEAGTKGLLRQSRTTTASVAAHVALLLCVAGVFHARSKLAPARLPGTNHGVQYLTYYSPGGLAHPAADAVVKQSKPQPEVASTRPSVVAPKPKEAPTPAAEAGAGNAVLSGVGEGDITIAFQKVFPYPKPDLSTLAHKSSGDVVLNAVIDERGNVTNLTLVKGLGPQIDDVVIATVKQWSYTPATKNGVPVPSETELHFHYERA